MENFSAQEACVSIFCRVFLSEIIEQRRKGTLLCFTKTLVSKKILDEEEGGRREGVPKISVKKPLSQSAEKFRTRTLLCCVQKVSGSEIFYGLIERESIFSVKTVLSQGIESFRRGIILCSSKFPVSKSFHH